MLRLWGHYLLRYLVSSGRAGVSRLGEEIDIYLAVKLTIEEPPEIVVTSASPTEQRRSFLSPDPFVVIGLVIVAACVRIWGLRWGLPDSTHLFSYHPDEYHSLRGLLSLALNGDLNPHFFNYGSLYLYLVSAAGVLGHGALISWLSLETIPEALRVWTLDARVVSALAGVLTVVTVYVLSRRIWSRLLAVFCTLLLALAPLHVLNSHYGTVDVTQALFVALALLFSVRLIKWGRWQDCVWAGLMAGLAASTKYNGLVVVVAPLTAIVLNCGNKARGHRAADAARKMLIVLGMAALGFALTSPFTFLAWSEAKGDILFEFKHMRVGEPLAVAAEPNGFWFHAKNLLAPGAGPIVILALVGWVMVVVKRHRQLLPIAVFACLWAVMISLANVRYARYEVALLPALVVLGTYPLAQLLRGSRCYRWAGCLLVVVCAVPALLWTGQVCSGLAACDPRAEALGEILRVTPAEARIGLVREPWFDVPPVDYCNGGAVLRRNPLWRLYHRPMRELAITDLDKRLLSAQAPRTFVLSEFNSRAGLRAGDAKTTAFVLALLTSYERQGRYGGLPLSFVPWELGSDWLYPWPEIQIFVRKHLPSAAGGK